MNEEQIYRKWSPIVEGSGVKNRYLIRILSEWLEYQVVVDDIVDINIRFKNILSYLDKLYRVEVVRTYYNPLMSSFEYELKNGLIVDDKGEFIRELDHEELVEVFGIGFVRNMNLGKFREVD